MTRLKVETKWRGEANYNKYERKYANGRSAYNAFIKRQAIKEDRRNAKRLIQFEITNDESLS